MTSKRVALVIGVADYVNVEHLRNPINDERDIKDSLKKLGFEVETLENPDLMNMSEAIDSFENKIRYADVCLFFYSGHGIEYAGDNYLIPVDASFQSARDLKYRAYNLTQILDKIDNAKVKTSIVILDACRSNPFTKGWATRGDLSNGLAPITYPVNGTFIGFAAQPGKLASDGTGRNGTYTSAILKYLNEENLSIDVIFNLVNKEVRRLTSNNQVPYKNSSLDDNFYFKQTGPDINNFTQEEFDKRVDTLVEAKLKEREDQSLKKAKGINIQKLFNSNESVIASALSGLLVENFYEFSASEVLSICDAYKKYIDKDTRVIGQNDFDFITLLDSIAQQKEFADGEVREVLKYYNSQTDYSEVMPVLLKIIDSSKAEFVTTYFKKKIEQSGGNHTGGDYYDRFLRKEYIQPVNFYLDYLDRTNKKSAALKSIYDSFIGFFHSTQIYKSNTLNLLNDHQLVDSVFLFGGINYESNFIAYRDGMRNKLHDWISDDALNKTYFFSTLCPCALGVVGSHSKRKFPCKN